MHRSYNQEASQPALDVGTTSKFNLEQRNDLISTKFRRCSVMCPLGSHVQFGQFC